MPLSFKNSFYEVEFEGDIGKFDLVYEGGYTNYAVIEAKWILPKGRELEDFTTTIDGEWSTGDIARFRFETKDNNIYDGDYDGEVEFYFDGKRKPSLIGEFTILDDESSYNYYSSGDYYSGYDYYSDYNYYSSGDYYSEYDYYSDYNYYSSGDYYSEYDYYSDYNYYSSGDYYSEYDYYSDYNYYSSGDYYSGYDYYSDYNYYSSGDYYSGYDYYSDNNYYSNYDYQENSESPKVKKAILEDNVVTITLDSQLDEGAIDADFFEVKADKKNIKISSIESKPSSGKLLINLSKSIDANADVFLSYNDLKGDQTEGVVQAVDGSDLESLEKYPVDNLTVRDESPLMLLFAEVDNDKVYLAFDRELDNVQPAPGIFRVTVDGKNNRVNDIQLNSANREAILTLKKPVRFDSTASISYIDANGDQKKNTIQDLDGNDLASFDTSLSNVTFEESDLQLVSGEVESDLITLSFNETLGQSIPSPKKFKVKVNNKKAKLSNYSELYDGDGFFNLYLKKPVVTGDNVVVSYKDLNGNQSNGVIEDRNGNDLDSFKNYPLDNVSEDLIPPSLEAAYIEDRKLYLDFDELISPGKIKGSRIKLYVGKKKYKVNSVTLSESDTEVSFDLKKQLPTDVRNLTLDYKDPKKDQSSGVIQDLFGNDLPTTKDYIVDI